MTDQYICQNRNCSTCDCNAAAESNRQSIDCARGPVDRARTPQNPCPAS